MRVAGKEEGWFQRVLKYKERKANHTPLWMFS
jgi:hypothetical protein